MRPYASNSSLARSSVTYSRDSDRGFRWRKRNGSIRRSIWRDFRGAARAETRRELSDEVSSFLTAQAQGSIFVTPEAVLYQHAPVVMWESIEETWPDDDWMFEDPYDADYDMARQQALEENSYFEALCEDCERVLADDAYFDDWDLTPNFDRDIEPQGYFDLHDNPDDRLSPYVDKLGDELWADYERDQLLYGSEDCCAMENYDPWYPWFSDDDIDGLMEPYEPRYYFAA